MTILRAYYGGGSSLALIEDLMKFHIAENGKALAALVRVE